MKIIENYLNKEDFINLKNLLLSDEFPWFYSEKSVFEVDKSPPQFFHNFFKDHLASNFYPILTPLIYKIKPLAIHRIKTNSTLMTSEVIENGLHPDMNQKGFTSALYFVNTCNGYCRIGNEKIYSRENSILFFDSDMMHTGTTCSDAPRRVIINMVYKQNELLK